MCSDPLPAVPLPCSVGPSVPCLSQVSVVFQLALSMGDTGKRMAGSTSPLLIALGDVSKTATPLLGSPTLTRYVCLDSVFCWVILTPGLQLYRLFPVFRQPEGGGGFVHFLTVL